MPPSHRSNPTRAAHKKRTANGDLRAVLAEGNRAGKGARGGNPETGTEGEAGTGQTMIARFVLPLSCAPTLNVYARMHWQTRRVVKRGCFTRMLCQAQRRKAALPGKPRVVMVRASKMQPDQDAGWSKVPLDCLKLDKQGLGFIRDDSPDHVDVECAWVRAVDDGWVSVEVWS